MPLTQCEDCGTEVSTRAATCPKCAAPMGTSAPAITESVHKGNQSSTLRQHIGQALALIGICVAVVVGMAAGAQAGAITAVVAVGLACVVAYS